MSYLDPIALSQAALAAHGDGARADERHCLDLDELLAACPGDDLRAGAGGAPGSAAAPAGHRCGFAPPTGSAGSGCARRRRCGAGGCCRRAMPASAL
ncbi:MAG: hypothetical protein MZV49_10465 [Rhodopseudomonas palustris]|nr:hypothetical protein [Rhodopseudomonas palustris]